MRSRVLSCSLRLSFSSGSTIPQSEVWGPKRGEACPRSHDTLLSKWVRGTVNKKAQRTLALEPWGLTPGPQNEANDLGDWESPLQFWNVRGSVRAMFWKRAKSEDRVF